MDQVCLSISITGDGARSDLPLQLAYVNSALQTGTRSLLDAAVVDYARSQKSVVGEEGRELDDDYLNLANWTKIAEVPFDSTRRLLSVLVSRTPGAGADEKGLFITKGAVEEVLDRCIQVYSHVSSSSSLTAPDHFKPNDSPALNAEIRESILETAEKANEDGLRLVAVACRSTVAMSSMTLTPDDERDLVFIGFLGFLDPVKPDAAEAVETLARLGVQVCHVALCLLSLVPYPSLCLSKGPNPYRRCPSRSRKSRPNAWDSPLFNRRVPVLGPCCSSD